MGWLCKEKLIRSIEVFISFKMEESYYYFGGIFWE